MDRFITIALIFAIMVHATFGCCFHHAHAGEIDCSENHVHEGKHVVEADQSEPDPEIDCNHYLQSPEHEGHLRCNDGKCSFARTDTSSVVDAGYSANLPSSLDVPVFYQAQHISSSYRERSSGIDEALDRIDLHLVLAVFLL